MYDKIMIYWIKVNTYIITLSYIKDAMFEVVKKDYSEPAVVYLSIPHTNYCLYCE